MSTRFGARRSYKVVVSDRFYNSLQGVSGFERERRICFLPRKNHHKSVRRTVGSYIFLEFAGCIKKVSPAFYNGVVDIFLKYLNPIIDLNNPKVKEQIELEISNTEGQERLTNELVKRVIENMSIIFQRLKGNTHFDFVVYDKEEAVPYLPSLTVKKSTSPEQAFSQVCNLLTIL